MVGLALTVLAVLVLVGVEERAPASLPGRADPSPATSPNLRQATDSDGVPVQAGAEIAPLLSQRGVAVRHRDRRAWLSTIDPASEQFRAEQGRVFDRIASLRPAAWSYSFQSASALPASQAESAPGGWLARVDLVYQLLPGGPEVSRRQYLSVVPVASAVASKSSSAASAAPARSGASIGSAPSGTATSSPATFRPQPSSGLGRWRISGLAAGPTESDLWDLSPITISRSSRCLLIGSVQWRYLDRRIASSCVAAASRVDDAWGTAWPRQTVLIVPDSQKQLGTLLDRSGSASKGLEQTAAVTVGPVTSAEEVLINPAVFKEFPALGIRVVLTHELVHVATRATGSGDVPTWLAEGFADYVGFGGSGLSPRQIASDALEQVGRGQIPSSLPADADFDSARKSAPAAYGFAWAVVKTIAAQGGMSRLVSFYRAAGSGGGPPSSRVDLAVRKVLRMKNTQVLIGEWQEELRDLAR